MRDTSLKFLRESLWRECQGLEFAMDGTFGGAKSVANVERALRHGYMLKILYIYQKPEIAWKYTKARELVEHRAISLDGFVETYYKLRENLRKLGLVVAKNSERLSVDLIMKNEENGLRDWLSDIPVEELDEKAPIEYNRETLRKGLKGIKNDDYKTGF